MLTSNSFAIFISILSLIVSVCSALYGLKYAKTNILHSIQKLMLDKSKECNDIYNHSVQDYLSGPHYIGQERTATLNYMTTIDEIIKSKQLLSNALREYKEEDKLHFFLEQFWIQLDNRIRRDIVEHRSQSIKGKRDKDMEEVTGYFQFLFAKYKR